MTRTHLMTPVPLDWGLSFKLQVLQKPKPNQCYRNSFVGLLYVQTVLAGTPLGDADTPVQYVEGHVCIDEVPIPIQHGWLQVDGRVIETTLPMDDRHTPDKMVYYPGLILDSREAVRIVTREIDGWLPICDFSPKHRWHTCMADSHDAAHYWLYGERVGELLESMRRSRQEGGASCG